MPLRRAVLALCVLLPVLAPEAASAATAQRAAGSDVLNVTAGNEVNDVTVTLSGDTYTIEDSAGMGAGDNCDSTPDPNVVTCPAGPVVTFSADLGGGNDAFSSTAATPATVLGGTGQDDLSGGTGPDMLVGGPGDDTVDGGAGGDTLIAESAPNDPATGQNTMDGGPGDDDVFGGAGPDTELGGTGADGVAGGGGADAVDGGEGDDAVSGGDGNDTVMGGSGNDMVGFHPADDGTSLERGDDVLDGGEGDDTIRPGEGPGAGATDADVITGGAGQDQVLYDTRTTPVVVTIDGVANDGMAGENDDVRGDVESVTGGTAGDSITGSAGNEKLDGGPGADVVNGGDGADIVIGGSGDDQLGGSAPGLPGAGKRPVRPAGLAPITDDDTLDGGDGNDTLDGGPGADRMSGGSGIDTTSYALAKSPVFVTLDGKPGDGEAGEGDTVGADVENLGGWSGQDTFTGSSTGNAMSSAGGEDYMDGAGGADVMTAGAGFDVVRARDGVADSVDCGSSRDFAILDKQDTVDGSCERVDRGLVKRPRLGRLVLSRPLHGGEAFGLAGMHRTVPLKDNLGLPFGSKLDATSGAVRLTAAATGGGVQTGTFSGGAFLVKQGRSRRGLTDVTLTGGTSLSKCGRSKAQVHVSAHRVLRRLFGRAHGRFRTRGRNSTATVRGTEWSVIDRCDGTLTTVKRGTVIVRDNVKHRTIKLKSGRRYLARRGNR